MKKLINYLGLAAFFVLFSQKTTAQVILGPSVSCPGGTFEYSVSPIAGVIEYTWSASGDGLINGLASPLSLGASGNSVQITMPSTNGPKLISMMAVDSSGQVFSAMKTVHVQQLFATNLPPQSVCSEDLPFVWCGTLVTGTMTCICPMVSAAGCDSIVQQTFFVKPPLITNLPPKTLCPGECFEVGGQSFCETGTYSVVLKSFQNCDSTVNFFVMLLDPKAEINGPTTICSGSSIVLSAPTTTNHTQKWFDFNQNLIGTGPEIVISQPGKYFLETTVKWSGVTCLGFDSTEITVGGNLPNLSTATPDSLDCLKNSVNLSAQSATPNVVFNWTGPENFTQTGPDAMVFLAGNYIVSATLPDGCTSKDTVSVAYFDRKNTFSLAQNPSILPMPPAGATVVSVSMTVKNEDTTAIDLEWERVFTNLTSGATVRIFDKNGLHQPMEMRDTFSLQPGESMQLKILINDDGDVVGCGEIHLLLKNLCTLRDTAKAIFKVECTVGTDEILGENNLRIFPNPTVEAAFFMENLTQTELFLKMTTPDGRLLFSKKIGVGRVEVAPPTMPSGAYFLFFENENRAIRRVEKLVRF